MSDKEAPFLKNADIRAGKIPGWASKPETNGDPYDPKNMERTDASMVVSDGLVMLNAASMHAAKTVGIRRMIFTALMLPVWGFAVYKGIEVSPMAGILKFGSTATQQEHGQEHGRVATAEPDAEPAQPSGYGQQSKPSGFGGYGQFAARRQEEREPAVARPSMVGNSTPGVAKANKPEVKKTESEAKAEAASRPDFLTASLLIDKFYAKNKDGVAKSYDLSFLESKYGWPKKAFPDVHFPSILYDNFSKKYSDGYYKQLSTSIADQCKGIELKECLKDMGTEAKFVAIADTGENMEKYQGSNSDKVMNDTVQPVAELEKILSDFKEQLPKTAPSYCDSGNRRYADTWGVEQATANVSLIQEEWENKSNIKFTPKIVKVDSVKEMVNHREEGDKECNNINVAVLPIKSGAVQYMMSVTARTHSEKGDQIASGLYLLGKLEDRSVMSLIACNNCSTTSLFTESLANSNRQKILPGLNISSSKIVSKFESSGYKLEVDKPKTTTTEKGA
jgi:hypothetical protein